MSQKMARGTVVHELSNHSFVSRICCRKGFYIDAVELCMCDGESKRYGGSGGELSAKRGANHCGYADIKSQVQLSRN